MDFDWQNTAVLLAVLAASAYLAFCGWRSVMRRKFAGCGACGSCPAAPESQAPPVISIGGSPAKAASR